MIGDEKGRTLVVNKKFLVTIVFHGGAEKEFLCNEFEAQRDLAGNLARLNWSLCEENAGIAYIRLNNIDFIWVKEVQCDTGMN